MSMIPIIVEESEKPKAGTLGGGVLGGGNWHVKQISVDTLKASLSSVSANLGEMFEGLKQVGNAELKEIQVAVEISAEGGVSLIGSAKAGMSGAITLTFALPD